METRAFAVAQANKLLERLAFQVTRTRRTPGSDAVHDLRVAIRRFTQSLFVFKTSFAPRETRKIRKRLKVTMALAGEVRDYDIAIKILEASRARGAGGFQEELLARRKNAAKALQAALDHWVARRSFSKWRTSLQTGVTQPDFHLPKVEDTSRRLLGRMAERFFREGDRASHPQASAAELHEFRIAAKKLRYTLELFAELHAPAADEWMEQIKPVQTLLGAINDYRSVRALVSTLGGSHVVEAALRKRQRRKTQDFRKLWTERFASPAIPRQWMHSLRRPLRKPIMLEPAEEAVARPA